MTDIIYHSLKTLAKVLEGAPTTEPVATNELWIDSGVVKFSSGIPPVVTDQPDDITVNEGATATFSLTATNATTYQWQRNTGAGYSNISGATSASYTTSATVEGDTGDLFRCVIVGPGGTVTSNAAELTVGAQWSIVMPEATNPIALLVEGNSMSGGIHTDVLTMLNTEYGSGRFSATDFSTSGHTTQQMLDDFASTVGPAIVDNATFCTIWSLVNDFYLSSITARAAVDLLWEWCDGANALGARCIVITPTPRNNAGTPGDYESRRQSALTLIRAEWASHCQGVLDIAADSRFDDPSDTTYFSDGVHLTGAGTDIVQRGIKQCIDAGLAGSPTGVPYFDTQPASQSVIAGETATFSAYAVGEGASGLTFQWQKQESGAGAWSNISGATANVYTTGTLVTASDNGDKYRCVATNRHGSTTSDVVTLTVSDPPTTPDTIASCLGFWRSDEHVYTEITGVSASTASSNGTTVGTWKSVIGSRYKNAAASGEAPTLITGELNSLPIVRFDGADDRIRGDDAMNAKTMFVVAKYRGNTFTGLSGLVTSTQNGEIGLGLESGATGTTSFQDAVAGAVTVRKNGTGISASGIPGPMNVWAIYVLKSDTERNYTWQFGAGRNAGRFGAFDIACCGFYSDNLTTEQCEFIESWATDTYGAF